MTQLAERDFANFFPEATWKIVWENLSNARTGTELPGDNLTAHRLTSSEADIWSRQHAASPAIPRLPRESNYIYRARWVRERCANWEVLQVAEWLRVLKKHGWLGLPIFQTGFFERTGTKKSQIFWSGPFFVSQSTISRRDKRPCPCWDWSRRDCRGNRPRLRSPCHSRLPQPRYSPR